MMQNSIIIGNNCATALTIETHYPIGSCITVEPGDTYEMVVESCTEIFIKQIDA